ncbi:unnamed protein product [Ilex paraguariensis]|uniref:J domain-containing protein n=1 Tax=Ilex paraguariensis TaxID=185542 RepID=A0ABC8SGR4_9AQUA
MDGKRWISTSTSTSTDSTPPEFAGKNAYDLLGVSETSSFAEIKASFRKLAKETHPDLAQSPNDSSTSNQFIQILAAYEILSDSEKRALYDRYLLSQRTLVQRHSRQGTLVYKYEFHRATVKQMEVVEWLRWYRCAINDILTEKRVVIGSGYFDVLERDFYSAIHAAYYGPEIESLDLLPDRFEAEERSISETPEVLHLVSGRDLFGMVCIAAKVPELSHVFKGKLVSFTSVGSDSYHSVDNEDTRMNSGIADVETSQMQSKGIDHQASDAYKDLQLQIAGQVVATAIRVPPRSYCDGLQREDSHDHIHVYLSSNAVSVSQGSLRDSFVGDAVGSWIPLGAITGLGTSPDEGSCFVYNKGC